MTDKPITSLIFWGAIAGFSLGRLHMGGICPPPYGGTSAGGQSVNRGRLIRGDIDLMGGT